MVSSSPERAQRRRQILDAAVQVFARDGHHDTRIQDIADAAGVAYGLVYHYFGTKDALLAEVFDENWAIFADVVDGVTDSDRSVRGKLDAVVRYAFGALEAYPARMRVIMLEYGRRASQGSALEHPEVSRVLARFEALFAEAGRAGTLSAGADPASLPVLFLGALQAAITALLAPGGGNAPDPARVRATVVALGHGIVAPPPPGG